jgi:nicotinamidase-related amidase
MPITQSAKKALRQNKTRHKRNVVRKDAYKKLVNKYRKAVSAKSMDEAVKVLPLVFQALDKFMLAGSAQAGIIYQNDFTTEGGVLHGAVSEVMEKTDMLANTRQVADAARAAGATVMHAPITFQEGYHELSDHPYGILKGVVDGNAFVKGSWGAAIVDDLAPAEDDIVIEGKRGLDTFASTNLDFILRSTGVTKIALGGFLTNCCVESTMRSAYERGYDVITLTDCVAATSQEEHANALTYDYPMFSRPMTSAEFVEELKGAGGGSDTSRGY